MNKTQINKRFIKKFVMAEAYLIGVKFLYVKNKSFYSNGFKYCGVFEILDEHARPTKKELFFRERDLDLILEKSHTGGTGIFCVKIDNNFNILEVIKWIKKFLIYPLKAER